MTKTRLRLRQVLEAEKMKHRNVKDLKTLTQEKSKMDCAVSMQGSQENKPVVIVNAKSTKDRK